ncbi:hypothetical protein HanRHA438_Chr17g0811831 [Helianthus annuus]|nr:hypothetical protein HanRHA438_Chr17g0811831 [Helianthus annuus]
MSCAELQTSSATAKEFEYLGSVAYRSSTSSSAQLLNQVWLILISKLDEIDRYFDSCLKVDVSIVIVEN